MPTLIGLLPRATLTVLMTYGGKTGAPVFQSTRVAPTAAGSRSCFCEGPQRVEAVVELVVAEGRGVVADRVHGRGHRVLRRRR